MILDFTPEDFLRGFLSKLYDEWQRVLRYVFLDGFDRQLGISRQDVAAFVELLEQNDGVTLDGLGFRDLGIGNDAEGNAVDLGSGVDVCGKGGGGRICEKTHDHHFGRVDERLEKKGTLAGNLHVSVVKTQTLYLERFKSLENL